MNYKNPIMKEKMKVVKVRMTSEMKYELQCLALMADVSVAEMVRRIVEEVLEDDRRQ